MDVETTMFGTPGANIRGRIIGDGPVTILFVHGMMVNHHVWRDLTPLLADDARLVLCDMPFGGHLMPMVPDADGSLAAHADRVIIIAEQLDGPVVLLGNDTGGAVAQLAATSRPDLFSGLVLITCDAFDNCPPKLLAPLPHLARVPGAIEGVAALMKYPTVQRLAMMLVSQQRQPDEVLDVMLGGLPFNRGIQTDFRKLLLGLNPDVTEAVAHKLPGFDRPSLVLWGEDDPLFPVSHAHRLGDLLPQATVATIGGSRAFMSLDQPHWVAEQLISFLKHIPTA